MATYGCTSVYLTNCFFYRPQLYFANSDVNPSMTMENCTLMDGFMVIGRNTWNAASLVVMENNAYDGTGFAWSDMFNNDTNDTVEDHNSYNTNNLAWQSFAYPYSPVYGTMQTVGADDKMVADYNWQTSWFGKNYLPSDSLLIMAGSTTADQIGLFYYTTQTNQTEEQDAVVDIGYHYVATDLNGIPPVSNGDGIPDYEDPQTGGGLPAWWLSLYYAGSHSVDLNNLDGASDGWTIVQKYAMGLAPNIFTTPPAPQGVTVEYNANNSTAELKWLPNAGNVQSYMVQKVYIPPPTTYPPAVYTNIFFVTGTTFTDDLTENQPDPYANENINVSYQVMAVYAKGNSLFSKAIQLEPPSFSANLVQGQGGNTYLSIQKMPANTTAIKFTLYYIFQTVSGDFVTNVFTNFSMPVSSQTNNEMLLSNIENTNNFEVVAQAVGTNGPLSENINCNCSGRLT